MPRRHCGHCRPATGAVANAKRATAMAAPVPAHEDGDAETSVERREPGQAGVTSSGGHLGHVDDEHGTTTAGGCLANMERPADRVLAD